MGEVYFNLKHKLEELGYSSPFPYEAVPLVECILADLLQTTRSLQHYMDLSKQALMQRDSLMMEAEPYKCDNVKLIQENNQLYQENILLKEDNLKINKENARKLKTLTMELANKDNLISKLQHNIRDLSLRGLCAETLSSRNRSKRKDGGETVIPKCCICLDKNMQTENDNTELKKTILSLKEKIEEYVDEIVLLKEQVEHRNTEIVRLKIFLEGGRPNKAVSKEFFDNNSKNQDLIKKNKELEITVNTLKKEMEINLEKQHEAMARALSLADKNKSLQEELERVDKLALKVEDDCNKRLNSMISEVNFLQTKNSELKNKLEILSFKDGLSNKCDIEKSLNTALQEKDSLQKEVKDLVLLNKNLQDKIYSLSEVINKFNDKFTNEIEMFKDNPKCTLKDEFRKLLDDERSKYEMYLKNMQDKLNDTINLFNKNITCKDNSFNPKANFPSENPYIRELHNKLCESEHKIMLFRKENEELKSQVSGRENFTKQKYQDIINHLNEENTQLSKENIQLSQQVSQYKGLNFLKHDRGDNNNVQRSREQIDEMTNKIQLLQKDKTEYNFRYKEAMDLVDKLKKDLLRKQKEIEYLQEENCSYKMSSRTEKVSVDLVKDECTLLKEQLKKVQNDFIKEKTITNQIRNLQVETERNSSEIQNELLHLQKSLSISNDTIESLEKKCKELQTEISALKKDKCDLFENIKTIDKERDQLIIDLDHKTENICMLEQKLKTQTFDLNKLQAEIADLNRKLNINRVSEHKIVDCESQISFLNGEILRLTQQYDNAIIENKHLQNSLADTNGVLKLTKIELDKSRKEVNTLKQQLQHYVAEIRRIEELLSQKEAERSDMLEHFASLSVEANILENTNHSLESESASKSLQLQTYVSKIQGFEEKLADKDNIIDGQSARIATMTCKLTALENEIKLITEEKAILKQNISYLKQMCNNMHDNQLTKSNSNIHNESELKLWEHKITTLTSTKAKLEAEIERLKGNLNTTENLLSNARKEIIELKLALQDATTETKILQKIVNNLGVKENKTHNNILTQEELELPMITEDRLDEFSNEDNDDSQRYDEINNRIFQLKHSSTL